MISQEELFEIKYTELKKKQNAMDKLETGLNFRKDELEARHAAMEEREEGMNELKQIRFNEHEKLMMELHERSQRMEDERDCSNIQLNLFPSNLEIVWVQWCSGVVVLICVTRVLKL